MTKLYGIDIVSRIEINRKVFVELEEINDMIDYGALVIDEEKYNKYKGERVNGRQRKRAES